MTTDLIQDIFYVCLIPLLGILTKYFIVYIEIKTKEITDKTDNDLADKYINMLSETIAACVLATNQTYVDTLKAEGKFDAEAQQIAFQKTLEAVKAILSEEALKYLTNMFGDLDAYITQQIEASVKLNKMGN